ncbi:MAG TPA: hypothetical protein VEQ40_07020 [Pyrinomonadaceae bacterium]|nr:hypothetical protein [Pyrinomonadaceae bacterium]
MSASHVVQSEIESAYANLEAWCRERDYVGHDPFDALNSRLFRALPLLSSSRTARLAWTQAFKRSPVNLRALALVPGGRNAKGTALFALAALAEFRRARDRQSEEKARRLLEELLAARLESKSGATCWGYNFDWQGRAFFAPKGTPTIVPTAFAARALVEAAECFNDEGYLKEARSSCDFILHDLNASEESEGEICWSYSPVDRTRVFNASLLAAETLCSVGTLTNESELIELAQRGARYVANRQTESGAWAYGADSYQSWSDNFHTAFILTSFARIMKASLLAREEFAGVLRRGLEFWQERFFLANGWPKYYPDRLYPADAHSAGAGIVALAELAGTEPTALSLADRIALWAIRHLQSGRGFFYYQKRRFYTIRTPYMRWSQSWMLYALARLLEVSSKSDE